MDYPDGQSPGNRVNRPFPPSQDDLHGIVKAASKALVLGIGGGGDVVGALAVARLCEALGPKVVLGGVSWERSAVDPQPGPRAVDEIRDGRALGEAAVLAGPQTSTPDGIPFSEARMAAHLDTETVLVDPSGGAVGAAAGIRAAIDALGCDLLVCVDVGGDVLAHGAEPGLASPLCDAVLVAAALRADAARSLLAVIGPGCDGELTAAEVLEHTAALGRAGAWLGTWGVTPAIADELAAAATVVTTEASLQVARCARGEVGEAAIRGGRRRVELGPAGALILVFDPAAAAREGELPLARAVSEAESIEEGRAALAALGVHTELDYERDRANESAGGPARGTGARASPTG
jgi:hypothetical protein